MTEDDSHPEDQKIVQDAVNRLMEHFDTVEILVTRQHPESIEAVTWSFNCGAGNFYARLGQVHEWLIVNDERARVHERKE